MDFHRSLAFSAAASVHHRSVASWRLIFCEKGANSTHSLYLLPSEHDLHPQLYKPETASHTSLPPADKTEEESLAFSCVDVWTVNPKVALGETGQPTAAQV